MAAFISAAIRIAFVAPRILNEPVSCRHSSLREHRTSAWSPCRGTTGVARTNSRLRACAARASSSDGVCSTSSSFRKPTSETVLCETRPSCGLGHRCGQLELDTVGILEGKHVNAERRQPGDLTVRHALLIEQSHGLLQVIMAGDPEAEM